MHPAVENLYEAKKVLDKLNITFWLEAGTLLLAYRDGAVDETDIDISVYDIQKVIDNLDKFYEVGFTMGHRFDHPSGLATELSLTRNGIKMDIWTKEFLDGQAWWFSYGTERLYIPHHLDEKYFKKLDTLTIWDETWNIPSDTEEFLEKVYGDWRTPNPNWVWWRDPKCIDYDYKFELTTPRKFPKKHPKLKQVTAVINNFMRPRYTKKCIESLRENYPEVQILVGNSDKPDKDLEEFAKSHGCEYMELPFDIGICVARNKMIREVKTKYVLIGDDDFFYTLDANLDIMLDFMDIADVCGGRIREGGKMRDYQGFIENKGDQLVYHKLLLDSWQHYKKYRYKDCDLVFNFFMAPTKKLLEVPWDKKIKVSYEHSDWFLMAKEAGMKVVFTPHCIVSHKVIMEPPVDVDEYKLYRNRRCDRDYFFTKRNLKSCIDMSGFMDAYRNE